jgi:hypothetical protein
MILYNVTINIDEDVHEDWLNWMKAVHIPDVMNTGLFRSYKICRILAEEDGGKSYAIQYFCESMEMLEQYQEKHAPQLQQEHTQRYSGKFGAFRTLLQVVDES